MELKIKRDEAESLLWLLTMLNPVSKLEIMSIQRWAKRLEKFIEQCDCKHKKTKTKTCYDGSTDVTCQDCGHRW